MVNEMNTNETKSTNGTKANVNQSTSKINETKAVTMPDGIKTADTDKDKANQAFMCLCNGCIDASQLMVFGEKNLRHALAAIKAFKDQAEQQKKAEAEKLQVVNDLLISAGLVNPSIDIKSIRGVKQSSINAQYHALCARANGATWQEIEELTAKENKTRGTNYKGLHKFIANFAKQRTESGYLVEYDAKGVKITDTKK